MSLSMLALESMFEIANFSLKQNAFQVVGKLRVHLYSCRDLLGDNKLSRSQLLFWLTRQRSALSSVSDLLSFYLFEFGDLCFFEFELVSSNIFEFHLHPVYGVPFFL